MITKLEIYAILIAVGGMLLFGAYFKGRHDELKSETTKQLAADAVELAKANQAIIARGEADERARAVAQGFIESVNAGLTHVQQQFAGIPQVVVDAHGCADLAPSFRLRWDSAVESLPGALGQPAEQPRASVPAAAVPPSR